MKTNRAVIIQCRLSSSRLPGKAIKILDGKPVLAWVLQSMKQVKADSYFVATDEDSYDVLKPICDEYKFECFAGPLNDVLERFCRLIRQIGCKTVIRATADNPFLFYEAAQASVEEFEKINKDEHCDYFTYTGLPHGSGIEVFDAQSLLKAATETSNPYDHEHVGPALYNHTDKYNCVFAKAPYRFHYPELRTTIDTYSDYMRANAIVNFLSDVKAPYSCDDIIRACNEKKVKFPVILVPSVIKGHGTGHLHRCCNVAIESGYYIYIPEDKTLEETDLIMQQYIDKGLEKWQIIKELPDETYLPVIITDTFELTKTQIHEIEKNRGLISIDEGSDFSDYCDYLLDIIPSFKTIRQANYTDSSFIVKSKNIHVDTVKNFNKVLICLGGEDPAGFTIPTVKAVQNAYPEAKITAIVSDFSAVQDKNEYQNVEFSGPVPNLRDQLYKYDLVFTHYGLTAFEAVYAGCGVILLPTTKLHKKLAEKYNFSYIKNEEITSDAVYDASVSSNVFPVLPVSKDFNSLADFLKTVAGGEKMPCPVCGDWPSKPDEVISRNQTRTYRRCRSCGMVYMSYTTESNKEYKKAYFFEDYKKQYGKTYQEDFESIKKQCLKRVSVIKSLCKRKSDSNVLDIGCAYGPFLSAADDMKLTPFGTDISEDAVSYVQNELHYPAATCAFPDIDVSSEFGVHKFDIVTMWYVIEHFKNLDSVLRKVNEILKSGGIFAFSTPSGEGVSAKSDKDHFYEISPTDHYTIWEPSKAHNILKKYGFEVVKIVSTGHHPERFPSIKKNGAKPGSIQWKAVDKMSHIKNLGDTVEIYCRKK